MSGFDGYAAVRWCAVSGCRLVPDPGYKTCRIHLSIVKAKRRAAVARGECSHCCGRPLFSKAYCAHCTLELRLRVRASSGNSPKVFGGRGRKPLCSDDELRELIAFLDGEQP